MTRHGPFIVPDAPDPRVLDKKCPCTEPAWFLKGNEPVCIRCARLEHERDKYNERSEHQRAADDVARPEFAKYVNKWHHVREISMPTIQV